MVNLNTIISSVVALIVIGAIATVGVTAINDANTTGWTSEQVLLFGFISTFFIITLFLAFVPRFGKKSD